MAQVIIPGGGSSATTLPAAAQKYNWVREPYHQDQDQLAWLNLATTLFNIDVYDILLPEVDKRSIISDLSTELSETLKGSSLSRKLHGSASGQRVRKMRVGTEPFVKWRLYASLLRCLLQPPQGWFEWEPLRQCWDALGFLQCCSTGEAVYTSSAMLLVTPDFGDLENTKLSVAAAPNRKRVATKISQNQAGGSKRRGLVSGGRRKSTVALHNDCPDDEYRYKSDDSSSDGDDSSSGSDDSGEYPSQPPGALPNQAEPVDRNRDSGATQTAEVMEGHMRETTTTVEALDKMALWDSAVVRGFMLKDLITRLRTQGLQDLAEVAQQFVVENNKDLRVLMANRLMREIKAQLKP